MKIDLYLRSSKKVQEYINSNLDQISKVGIIFFLCLRLVIFQVRENLEKLASILVSETKREER